MAHDVSDPNESKKMKFSVAIQTEGYKNLINNTLGDKEVARKFVADISSVVSNNYALKECDAGTILSAGFTASSLKLPLSPTLGFCYVVPYQTKDGIKKAQFQIGYKGLIQLAERTGQYKTLGVRPVHDGEYSGQDKFGEDQFKFSHEFDAKPIVGYFAYIELVNGFNKTFYMTKAQCEAHAKQYSRSYGNSSATNLWRDNFDLMAEKTVLKLLINRYGIMSVELQTAVQADQAIIKDDGSYDYVDNEKEEEPLKVSAAKANDTQADKPEPAKDPRETTTQGDIFDKAFNEGK
jgi:recombination protein RecT